MSVNSLPSFAQAFSNHSLDSIDITNALPPIMPARRKRDDDDDPRVKDESPEPDGSNPPPSPLKKRRVTVSGTTPHPLRIDVHPPPQDQSLSTPISPVVMGFTVQPDNIHEVRSMISVKQKQQALIEQRRGSAADIATPPSREQDERAQPPPTQRTTARRSPNQNQAQQPARRPTQQRAPSPPPAVQPQTTQHSLPPPPISFARRRAAVLGGKKKPADIIISPREAHSKDQFQPSIQSAPPSQNAFRFQMAIPRLPNIIGSSDNVRRTATNVPPTPTRLSMQAQLVQNRSPPAPSVPISSSLVPPTPTSLHRPGYQGDKAAFLAPFELFYDALNDSKQLKTWLGEQLQKSSSLAQSLAQQQERISETVESLVEKRLSGIRSEMTALRRRVGELEEALSNRASLSGSPTVVPASQNQNKQNNKVLQNGLPPVSSAAGASSGGAILGPVAPEAYTFPPGASASSQEQREAASSTPSAPSGSRLRPGPERPELARRLSSPGGNGRSPHLHHQHQQHQHLHENGRGSPAANFDPAVSSASSTRMSMSATRHEPLPPPPPSGGSSSSQPRSAMQSPPLTYRDRDRAPHRPPSPPSRHSTGSGPPSLSRQNSGVPLVVVSAERERDRDRERERDRRDRERDREEREYVERERERERDRERDRERERERDRRDAVMSPPEDDR